MISKLAKKRLEKQIVSPQRNKCKLNLSTEMTRQEKLCCSFKVSFSDVVNQSKKAKRIDFVFLKDGRMQKRIVDSSGPITIYRSVRKNDYFFFFLLSWKMFKWYLKNIKVDI